MGEMRTGVAVSCMDGEGERSGLELVDQIDRHRCVLYTPSAPAPRSIGTDRFSYPIDRAVEIHTAAITLPTVAGVNVRDSDGDVLVRTEEFADESFPPGRYILELSAPIKVYLIVESSVRITANVVQTHISFGGETAVSVGARSRHQSPAATITTTDDPIDMMAAVSAFGSALKTTSCERSYPTLRGHPPAVELGSDLVIPDAVDTPETGVTIEIPAEYQFVYTVASLAYYLGATVVPGTARIVTRTGFEHRLDSSRGFEREVERVLKQVVFLDCLTRMGGENGIRLHERQALDSTLDIALDDLQGQSLPDQLEAYLSVPFADIESHLPEWKMTSHVSPSPDSIETLPFLVNDLAVIRTPRCERVQPQAVQADAISEFVRNGALTRSTTANPSLDREYIQPEASDSLEQVWVGDETPLGASKATTTAFRNRLHRSPTDGDITITAVCNEPEMADERDAIDSVYGSREELPFDVRLHEELTTDELAAALTTPADLLHYIGHIDQKGFRCPDGLLDLRTLDTVGVDAFFLNACQSYEQGMALIDAGAIGGIVTLGNVINTGAVTIGHTMSRLLNRGFPLRAAMTIARDESLVSNQYLVIGDGGLAITQAESGMPMLGEIDRTGPDQFELNIIMYPTSQHGMGSVNSPFIEGEDEYHLSSGGINTYELSTAELEQFLALERIPVRVNGTIRWSDEITLAKL